MTQLLRLTHGRPVRWLLAGLLAVGLGAPAVANAQPPVSPCLVGSLPSHDVRYPADQITLVCIPANWNGQLIVYAHGYVSPFLPLALPAELSTTLPTGQTLPELLVEQGFAFASTSYHKNGYAVEQGGADLKALVAYVRGLTPPGALQKVYLVGASEGGLITTMLVERFPEIFTGGGLALCAPVGGMPLEVKYMGDFGAVFNYFFPGVAAAGPDAVAAALMANAAPGGLTDQLFNVTGAARDPADPATAVQTALGLLAYNADGAADLFLTTGGSPFNNLRTRYRGSADDAALNAGVLRSAGTPAARAYVRRYYQPSGELERPLVTVHTTLDPIVPFSHAAAYRQRVRDEGGLAQLTSVAVDRYGHCTFTPEEILGGFVLLLNQAGAPVSREIEDHAAPLHADQTDH